MAVCLTLDSYWSQARKAGACAKLTALLKRCSPGEDDDDALEAMSAIITACSGPMASGDRIRTFQYGELPVTVKEGALGDGVGAKVWTVAHTLCQEMVASPGMVQGRTVLEIGAGCGVCGFLAGKLGAQRVVVSDYVDQLLVNLREALHLNGFSPSVGEQRAAGDVSSAAAQGNGGRESLEAWDPEDDSASECSDLDAFFAAGGGGQRAEQLSWEAGNVEIRFVDWRDSVAALKGDGAAEGTAHSEGKASAIKLSHYALDGPSTRSAAPGLGLEERFDVIIGTDVLYEWSMAESVAAVIAHRLRPDGVALLCCAVRDQAMFDALIGNMGGLGLDVKVEAIHPRAEDNGVVSSEQEYEGGYVMVTCSKCDI